ncbi:MAG TPA: alkaline phosphatase family protein, partial [Candidatus Dormibacteraeota bacterium]
MSTLPPGSTHEKWMQRLPRRDFLRWGGALAAAAATPLALPRLVSAAPPLKAPGSLPFPTHAAGTPNLLPGMANIEHIVMVMMENHSFDAYLGMLPWRVPSRAGRVNGFQRLGADGRPLVFQTDAQNNVFRSFPATDPCQLDGYPHPQGPGNNQGWDGSHQSFNGGLMDGFARADGEAAMEYWDDQHLIPFYYDLARYFPVCDNYFSSTLAPTYPNRVFFFAASAGGLTATDTPPPASLSLPFGNIFTLLEENGVDWGGYYTNLPSPGLLGYTFAAQREAPAVSPIDHRSHLFGAGGDLNGTLALVEPRLQLSSVGLPGGLQPVTIIEEDFLYGTEEPPQNMLAGQYFVYRVLQLFMKYPNVWAKTMIILNYDEAGGFY